MLRQLEAMESEGPASGHRVLAWSGILALVGAAATAIVWWAAGPWRETSPESAMPSTVEVNFLTEPYFNATIWLDGEELLDAGRRPYVTPCTVPDVPAGEHRVVFKHAGHDDLDAGLIDFAGVREVEARWQAAPERRK
jgi:hypothetical protein